MYSRRVVVAVLVGLLVLVFLIGDASADRRRKEILPQYMEWGDPDQPAFSNTFNPDRGPVAYNMEQAELRHSRGALCMLGPIGTPPQSHPANHSKRFSVSVGTSLIVTISARR